MNENNPSRMIELLEDVRFELDHNAFTVIS